ncbi:hypothetical protein NQ317_016647 [Molorchus minor]|uniref:Uncharacterized protein n=1 Tax=Molorchus minor TaxID=1323400 RepID=A0ABQ9J0A7_9CUCU|nr:hypothetical protein NQ317_016647 [Molorchus minor]
MVQRPNTVMWKASRGDTYRAGAELEPTQPVYPRLASMSYINKKTKIFKEGPETLIVPSRSEARIKNYMSATDARAWCDIVEQRRQHILEFTAKNKDSFCLPKVIPLEVLFNSMMVSVNCEIDKLERKADYMEKRVAVYSEIDLTEEQQSKLDALLKWNNLSL